jgi:uncharacterized protein YoxC
MSFQKTVAIGILALSGTVMGADDKKAAAKGEKAASANAIPVYVGSNVVAQVDDLRESVGDLVDALKEANDNYGYADPKAARASLDQMQQRLGAIEEKLDVKEERADDTAWLNFYNNPQYQTTVHESVRDIGSVLTTIAKNMEGGSKTTAKLPYRVADNVVDQVDDVRESVGDLVNAINSSGRRLTWYNWEKDQKKLSDYSNQLNQLENRLDRKQAAADSEWVAWFGADVYKVTVHDSIAELGNIVSSIGNSLASRPAAKSSH